MTVELRAVACLHRGQPTIDPAGAAASADVTMTPVESVRPKVAREATDHPHAPFRRQRRHRRS